MSGELLLDGFLLLLMAVLIGYCVVLNRRLKAFNQARLEMAGLVNQLNEATDTARSAIVNLKNDARREEGHLKDEMDRARVLADELEFITRAGSNIADRIERGVVVEKPGNIEGKDGETPDDDMRETLRNIR